MRICNHPNIHLEIIKLHSKFNLLINVKMPTIDDILTFISTKFILLINASLS